MEGCGRIQVFLELAAVPVLQEILLEMMKDRLALSLPIDLGRFGFLLLFSAILFQNQFEMIF